MPLVTESSQPPWFLNINYAGKSLARLAIAPRLHPGPADIHQHLSATQRDRLASMKSPNRAQEYALSRWLASCLLAARRDQRSISHCRRYIAVGIGDAGRLGIDVESRLPVNITEISQRLGWPDLGPEHCMQAWTLWEAWRKLEGGSVLDAPDNTFRAVLDQILSISAATVMVAGVYWRSVRLEQGCLSLALLPKAA